jgi:radical SAM protein with 4Fe4S-binding SPASM domain
VTADGGLALCDAMTQPRGSVDDLSEDVGRIREIFADVDAHDPFADEQCGSCSNVGICGGKLYCKPDPYDFLPFELDEFLRFFVEAYEDSPSTFDLGLSGR